jgi:hypothetical protein
MHDKSTAHAQSPSSVPQQYIIPASARRRIRLQGLPAGNYRLLFEAEGRSGAHVIYASAELGRTTAPETLEALGRLWALVAERGLP